MAEFMLIADRNRNAQESPQDLVCHILKESDTISIDNRTWQILHHESILGKRIADKFFRLAEVSAEGTHSMTSLLDFQKRIADEREKRGFVTEPIKIALLLSEEVGEIASEIKRLWSKNYDRFCADRLEEEIADTFVVLAALADQFDIDIEEAVERKFFDKDAQREWKSAQVRRR